MTNDYRQGSPDPRFATWIGAAVTLFLVALAVGFIWLPSAQQGAGELSFWGIICHAVGLPYGSTQASAPAATGRPSSTVAWTVATRRLLTRGDAVRGAAHATTCNGCHGANGVSADAAIPNLAGQSIAAIYKQLEDFKDGNRGTMVMRVFVASLSQEEMVDLATYYAALPDPFTKATKSLDASYPAARHLTDVGNPMRSIASCAACHGPLGLTTGAPDLRGQQRAYLEEQMQEFKVGTRHNDINEQMRSVAQQLSADEIAMLAAYYWNFADISGR